MNARVCKCGIQNYFSHLHFYYLLEFAAGILTRSNPS